jgi:hypothetical protein
MPNSQDNDQTRSFRPSMLSSASPNNSFKPNPRRSSKHLYYLLGRVGLIQVLGPRNIGHESGFLANCQPRIVGWSCPKTLAIGFGQLLGRALILIGGARSFPDPQWKPAKSS